MGRSLSLAAYRALSRRKSVSLGPDRDLPPRPRGELLWVHISSQTRFEAINDLTGRLRAQRPETHVLLTYDQLKHPDGFLGETADDVFLIGLHSDHPWSAREFMAHWKPDMCVWTGGELMVNQVNAAAETGIPMLLVDVANIDFSSRRHKWFPDLTRTSLDFFHQIITNSDTAARTIRRLGISRAKVSTSARLRGGPMPPPCSDDEVTAVLNDLAGRPVWLAARARTSELDAILYAHRTALRLSHRLLLILTLDDQSNCDDLKLRLSQAKMRFADWDSGDAIEDSTQVLISGDVEELGLWYRVSPLTLMASSLSPEAGGCSPLDAAALGSAILYGPNVGPHIDTYSRLSAAGAARVVSDGENLSAALVQLVAPDRAAAMALAGWEVATEGAELTNQLIDRIQDMLDNSERPNARP